MNFCPVTFLKIEIKINYPLFYKYNYARGFTLVTPIMSHFITLKTPKNEKELITYFICFNTLSFNSCKGYNG